MRATTPSPKGVALTPRATPAELMNSLASRNPLLVRKNGDMKQGLGSQAQSPVVQFDTLSLDGEDWANESSEEEAEKKQRDDGEYSAEGITAEGSASSRGLVSSHQKKTPRRRRGGELLNTLPDLYLEEVTKIDKGPRQKEAQSKPLQNSPARTAAKTPPPKAKTTTSPDGVLGISSFIEVEHKSYDCRSGSLVSSASLPHSSRR